MHWPAVPAAAVLAFAPGGGGALTHWQVSSESRLRAEYPRGFKLNSQLTLRAGFLLHLASESAVRPTISTAIVPGT